LAELVEALAFFLFDKERTQPFDKLREGGLI
jgi:hypothetical protein